METTQTQVRLSTAIRITPRSASHSDQVLDEQSSRRDVGVCFSGGGSRALSATMGQLRGLSHSIDSAGTPWIDRVGTISCVSGGCWASSLYTYLPDSITYEAFLNSPAEPSQLSWEGSNVASNLSYLPSYNLGEVPTRLGWEALLKQVQSFRDAGFNDSHQWWRAAIGNLVFRPFGLYDTDPGCNPKKYYGFQPYDFQRTIGPFNPLTENDFFFARNPWPRLTMNAAMFYPDWAGQKELVPFFSTMEHAGVLAEFPQDGQSGPTIGGGTVQPFALGSSFASKDANGRVQVNQSRPFSLVDMAAMSSSAFAAEFENRYALGDLVPQYDLWPVYDGGSAGQQYDFADGGNIENSGLANLLATTRLKKIVVFINSSEAVEHKWSTSEYTQVPATIPPLFGYQPIAGVFDDDGYRPYAGATNPASPLMQHNKVFPESRFQELLDGLKNASNNFQDSAIFFQPKLSVQINKWYGISETREVDVLWVCNNRVNAWEDQITDQPIRNALFLRDVPDSSLWNFPYYGTLTQLHLSAQQVNMLAHLSCWNVMAAENRTSWQEIFS